MRAGPVRPRTASRRGHPWIEFVNRLITGAVSVAVALAVLGSLRRAPSAGTSPSWSWGLVGGVLAQILLGALVVMVHVHPIAVQGHFLVSAVLVANAVVLHHRAARPDGDAATRRSPPPSPARPCCGWGGWRWRWPRW